MLLALYFLMWEEPVPADPSPSSGTAFRVSRKATN